jgi:hypothetical protein
MYAKVNASAPMTAAAGVEIFRNGTTKFKTRNAAIQNEGEWVKG